MMKLFALAAVVGLSSGDIFKWNKNNDMSNPSNWKAGVVPTGTKDLSQGCIADFGALGGAISMDFGGATGQIIFPSDGQVVMEGDFTVEFTGATDNSGEWRCKNATEYLTSCSDNFLMKTGDGWVPADTAPCYDDTLQIDVETPTSLMWGGGQYIGSVEMTDINDNVVSSYKSAQQITAIDGSRMFIGAAPKLNQLDGCGGALMCQMLCQDICPERDLAIAVQNRDDFFSLPEDVRDKVIEDVRVDQDTLNGLRFDATEALNNNIPALKNGADKVQTNYESALLAANFTRRRAGDATIAALTLTAAQMANWMEAEGVGDVHAVHYIRHSLTKENAEMTVDFFDNVALGNKYYGTEAEPGTYSKMTLNDELWVNIDAKGTVRGDRRRASYFAVSDFIISDANQLLSQLTNNGATIISFVGPVAVAADDSLDFALAAGGFLITDVVVRVDITYVDDDGTVISGVSPEIIELALATSMTRMALFARAEDLRLAIHFRPTTTWSPTTSPTVSPTIAPTVSPTTTPTVVPTMSPTVSPTASADFLAANLIPIAAGGGGALLLIILIILVCVIVASGSKKRNKAADDKDRNVVAFENPMYDDPAATTSGMMSNTVVEDAGLYDEPTFNASVDDKSNPMYQSNEDVGASDDYLDVQPDEDDDDDDEDDDDEDEKQADEVTQENQEEAANDSEDDDSEDEDDDEDDDSEDE